MGRSLRYRGGLLFRCHKNNNLEGTNPKVVNSQRIKHYISGNPINVETNVIETVTPEEYIRDLSKMFQTPKRNRYVAR